MAITNFDGVVSGLATSQKIPVGRDSNFNPNTLNFYNMFDSAGAGNWKGVPGVGAFVSLASNTNIAVTGGPTPTANCGCIPFQNATGGRQLYLGQMHFQSRQAGTLLVYDRIMMRKNINAGTDLSITGSPNFTVPASPDERWYSGGVGVEAWIEIAGVGGGARNLSVKYTNSDGTTGRQSPTTTLTSGADASTMWRLGMASGDRGVRSVESVTCDVASTSLSIVLMRQLAAVPVGIGGGLFDFAALGLPAVAANCGLSLAFAPSNSSGSVQMDMTGILTLIEG